MFKTILFLFTLLLPLQQFAAERQDRQAPPTPPPPPPVGAVRVLQPLGKAPKPLPAPTRLSAVLLPGFFHGTTNKNLLAQNFFFTALGLYTNEIRHNANIVGTSQALANTARREQQRLFHVVVLNDEPTQRDQLFGYAFVAGDPRLGLEFKYGNMREFLPNTSAKLNEIANPFTVEGAENNLSLDKHLRRFVMSATIESGVTVIQSVQSGRGKAAQARRAQIEAPFREAQEMLAPDKVVDTFLTHLIESGVAAIQNLGHLLHKAEIALNALEMQEGRNFDNWRNCRWAAQGYTDTQDSIRQFWASLGSWALASLNRQEDPTFNDGSIPQKIDALKALSPYWPTQLILAHTALTTNAGKSLMVDGRAQENYINNLRVEAIQAQDIFDQAAQELGVFVDWFTNVRFAGPGRQGNPLSQKDAEKAHTCIHKALGALTFSQIVLAAAIAVEAGQDGMNPDEKANVAASLTLLEERVKVGVKAIMAACDNEIKRLQNAPHSQNVFKLLKAFLSPFITERNGVTPDYDEAIGRAIQIQRAIDVFQVATELEHTTFRAQPVDVPNWVRWIDMAIEALKGSSIYDELRPVVNDLEWIMHNNLHNGLTEPDQSREPESATAFLRNYNLLRSPEILHEDYTRVMGDLHMNATDLLTNEVTYFLAENHFLLPTNQQELRNFNVNHSDVTTVDIAKKRMLLLNEISMSYYRDHRGQDLFNTAADRRAASNDALAVYTALSNPRITDQNIVAANVGMGGNTGLPPGVVQSMVDALHPDTPYRTLSHAQRSDLITAILPVLQIERAILVNMLDPRPRPRPGGETR